jgi:hypothetical protein
MHLNKIDKNHALKQFLLAVSEGCTMMEGGKKAGFSHPETSIARELHNPDFLPAMSHALRHRLGGALALKAMNIAEELLTKKSTSPRIRWDIAKTILAAGAGFVPPKARETEAPPQDISNMSANDIMALRQTLEQEMANRSSNAKIIDAEPLDFLD